MSSQAEVSTNTIDAEIAASVPDGNNDPLNVPNLVNSNLDQTQTEDSSSGEFDSDSESDEEEEPKLKYERVRGDLATLLERDSLTTIASNDKVS